jgi:hypothetical protein
MTVVKRRVPSLAASGNQTFSDSLVGVQITDGSSQLANTNFAVDKIIDSGNNNSLFLPKYNSSKLISELIDSGIVVNSLLNKFSLFNFTSLPIDSGITFS